MKKLSIEHRNQACRSLLNDVAISYCRTMTSPRRPRGSVDDPIALGWKVQRKNKDFFTELASKAGLSGAAMFDLMIENLELDERGLPAWAPMKDDEGKLPIDKP